MREKYLELAKKIISLYSTESKEEFESKFITEIDSFISKIVTPMMKPLYNQINHQQKIINEMNRELEYMKDKQDYSEDNAMNGTETFNI